MWVRIETEKDQRESEECARGTCRFGKWMFITSVASLVFAAIFGSMNVEALAVVCALLAFGAFLLSALSAIAALFLHRPIDDENKPRRKRR